MDTTSPASKISLPGADPDFWRQMLVKRDANPVPPWTGQERGVLANFNRRMGVPQAVLDNIERLGDPKTLVVIAGQQAGLFLAPFYTLYKAIAAVKWAERLAEILGRPVVPAFWIASEDHDYEEVRRVHYLDANGRDVEWKCPLEPAPGTSIFDIPADAQALGDFLNSVEADTRPTEFKAEILGRWRRFIDESESLEDFFSRGMADLLGATGLILLPSGLPAVRRRATPIVRREIERPLESTALLLERAKAMEEAGEEPPVHRREGDVNFFLYREGLRCKVTYGKGCFQVVHPSGDREVGSLSAEDLLKELDAAPEYFSPNVALRPVIQDSVLPVLAMIGGPGERKYLAMVQEAGLYDLFQVAASHVLARPRAVLIEPRVERLLEKYGMDEKWISREEWSRIEEVVIRAADEARAIESLENLKKGQVEAFERFASGMGDLGKAPAVVSAIRKTSDHIQQALGKMEQRIRDELKREQETAGGQLHRLFDALRPGGAPQERVLSPIAPFQLNYGDAFAPWLVEGLDLDAPALQVLRLSDMHDGGEAR